MQGIIELSSWLNLELFIFSFFYFFLSLFYSTNIEVHILGYIQGRKLLRLSGLIKGN